MATLQLELGQQRVDVRGVPVLAAGDGDEVAVPAAVGAERDVDVEVADAHPCIVAPAITRRVPSRGPSGGPQAYTPGFRSSTPAVWPRQSGGNWTSTSGPISTKPWRIERSSIHSR